MGFHKIDLETWPRKSYYDYYMNIIKCRYSLEIQLDITRLYRAVKSRELKFYPCMIYAIITAINQNQEFRMAKDEEGNLGYWDVLHPSYTIFHDDTKTFSDLWSEFHEDFPTFYKTVRQDMETYKDVHKIKARDNQPPNFCPISCIPWISFTGHSNDSYGESPLLFPVILFGKYYEQGEKMLLPFSVYIHHAVADGYHTSKLLNDLQAVCDDCEHWMKPTL